MATGTLTGTTQTAESIFTKLQQGGVSKADAQVMVAGWILENLGALPKTFAFKTSFPGTVATCASQFARSFAHEDWVDGEDVVQAEQTTGEEGFNLRFHRIESDLDSLGRDVAQAFVCINAMRSSLRALLDEVQSEINMMYRQMARSSQTGKVTLEPGGPFIAGKYIGRTKYFDKFAQVFETPAGNVIVPVVDDLFVQPFVNPRVERVRAFGQFLVNPKVDEAFKGDRGLTKAQFLEAFGKEVLSNGETVAQALEIIPANTKFSTVATLMDGLATREGAAMKTSGIENESIALAFGLEGSATVADAPIDRMEVIPEDARAALVAVGIATVAAFASTDIAKTTAVLQERGVDVHAADVAGWVGASKALSAVR
jgi:hypothetical protein